MFKNPEVTPIRVLIYEQRDTVNTDPKPFVLVQVQKFIWKTHFTTLVVVDSYNRFKLEHLSLWNSDTRVKKSILIYVKTLN